MKHLKSLAIILIATTLAACGGGSSDSPPKPQPTKTASFKGKVTTSKAMYFGAAKYQRAKAAAVNPACPGLNIDSDGDGIPDTLVDVDGDCIADYTIINGDQVALIGATVTLTNVETGASIVLVTNDQANFEGKVPPGNYDIETRTKAGDGAVIWGIQRSRTITDDTNAGEVGLSRNPVIQELTVDGGSTGRILAQTYTASSTRKLSVGDTVRISVKILDPNNRPIVVTAHSHLGAGYTELPVTEDASGFTLTYTVASTDMGKATLEFYLEGNNDDEFTGADQYRDTRVTVSYSMAGARSEPALLGFNVNGTKYTNDFPQVGMTLTTAAVAPGTAFEIETLFDKTGPGAPDGLLQWSDHGALVNAGPTATVPATAQEGVYSVTIFAAVYLSEYNTVGTVSTLTVPVATDDKPAQLTGLLINGADPFGRVFKVGSQLSLQAVASDPKGLPLEYQFDVVGGEYHSYGWSPSNTLAYTVTQADVTANFQVRVRVRNNDGRVLEMLRPWDAANTYFVSTSE